MLMTNYMKLLGQSIYHLTFLMVLPMLLAELLVATEIFSLLKRDDSSSLWHIVKRYLGRFLATYYTALVLYIFIAVLPDIQMWRGWVDRYAIWCLISAVIPLWGLLLLSLKKINSKISNNQCNWLHAIFLVTYLILGHLAMIFGMTNPEWIGYKSNTPTVIQHGPGVMPNNMNMKM